MSIWFTSDTHWFHRNIIKYSNRPFTSVEEMNEGLITNWNARVAPNDTVYHLGDFGFAPARVMDPLAARLNGEIHLILGNHDKEVKKMNRWASVQAYRELYIGKQHIVLFHYGMRVWNRSHHGTVQLYGHSHGSLPGNSQSLDVGVDCWDYKPINFEEIKARLATLPPFRNVDHHGRDAKAEM